MLARINVKPFFIPAFKIIIRAPILSSQFYPHLFSLLESKPAMV